MPTYYVPSMQTAADVPRRVGVGLPTGHANLADVDFLRVEWFYDWGCSADFMRDARYVPMSWDGGWRLPLPADYSGYLLVLNEPDNQGQLNINPALAAARIRELGQHYPQARLIVGGISYFGEGLLKEFVRQLGDYRPAGWHVHGYCEWSITAQDVFAWFERAREICPGGQFWLTEFADVGTLGQAEALLDLVRGASWIDRYAWFASRVLSTDWYLPAHWQNPSLIGPDGQLSVYGRMYRGEQ